LETLGYVLLYFSRGSLPWQGLKAQTKKQKYEKITEKKIGTTIEQLCKGRSLTFVDQIFFWFLLPEKYFKHVLTFFL
jgi:hypothetical protein